MAFDDNTFNTWVSTAVADSFNEDNSLNVDADVDVTDSFNEDNSVNDSGNVAVGIDDSFKNDSDNVDVDIDDSGNVDSYNDTWEFTDASTNDNSVNAGLREYNLGFSGAGFGVAGAAGDVKINNQNTVVDQSASNNIVADGPVFQYSANQAQVASGDEAMAAGDNIDITTTVDQSTNISADGDVLIDSVKNVDVAINSGNTYDFSYSYEDNSVNVDIVDSFNSVEWNTSIDDSFNDESLSFDYTDVDVDVNAIVGSNGAAIIDDIAL